MQQQNQNQHQQQPYQPYDYSSNQSYDYASYNQYYYPPQTHQHYPYSSYYTHHDYTNAYTYYTPSSNGQTQPQQPQHGDDSSIYPPGVPPPYQQFVNPIPSSATGEAVLPPTAPAPAPAPAWPHHQEYGPPVMVEGHANTPNVVSSAGLNYVTGDNRKQSLSKQHQKVAHQVVRPSHGSTSGAGRKGIKGPAKVRPPRANVWCEVCGVDCNSLEIMEQHKNGKKHKKMLQKLSKVPVRGQNEQTSGPDSMAEIHNHLPKQQKEQTPGPDSKPEIHNNLPKQQNEQSSAPDSKPEIHGHLPKQQNEKTSAPDSKPETHSHLPKGEGSLQPENLPSQSVTQGKEVESAQQKDVPEKKEGSVTNVQNTNVEQRGRKTKRKTKGGKGGKCMKSSDGSRVPVEPPKPKQVVPLICELCNVKCNTSAVFQSHLAGKKHLMNAARFQEQQAMLGQAALQALYPALQALVPALEELCQGDISALVSQLEQQGTLNPQNFFGQPVPFMLPQGQSSEMGPATLSTLPQSSTFYNEQQEFQGEGSRAAMDGSSNAAKTEGKSQEQVNPGPNSNAE